MKKLLFLYFILLWIAAVLEGNVAESKTRPTASPECTVSCAIPSGDEDFLNLDKAL